MKILKTLAVFFVLLALTVGAVAQEYTPFGIGELKLELPRGLEAKVTQTKAGHIDVLVDCETTDWTAVVAQMDHWGAIPVFVDTQLSFGATAGLGNLFFTEQDELPDWSYSTMKPLFDKCFKYIEDDIAGGRTGLGGVQTIMDYSVSTNALVPRTYSEESGQWLFFLEGYCNDAKEIVGKKYCTIGITYTDPSARKVVLNKVLASRITASDKATATVTNGNVAYELENSEGHTELVTVVQPPAGTKSFLIEEEGGIKQGAIDDLEPFTHWAPPKDHFNAFERTLYWYAGEYDAENNTPTGDLIRAERLNISISIGNPVVWPNYVPETDMEKVSKENLSLGVYNRTSGKAANPAFAAVDYADDIGTVTIKRDKSKNMPKGDLTEYDLVQRVTAPENAVYYSYYDASYIESVFKGTWALERDYLEKHKKELDEADRIEVPTDGIIEFADNLFSKAEYSGADEGLVTYYDYNVTEDDSGDIVFVQWYDDAGNVIGVPQWFAIQYQTMAVTTQTEIESDIPADAEDPTLFTTADAGGYTLKVTSYPQSSEEENQIHYELELFNENGEYVELKDLPKGEYNLFIPFPDDLVVTEDLTFTVNHYNADSSVILESANEIGTAKVELKRETTGVWMKVTSLSPFVMSWAEAECEHKEISHASSVTGSDKDSEGVVVETCNDCTDHKASWVITVDKTCVAGKELGYKITRSAEWLGGDPTITYIGANAMEIFDKTPTTPGKYELSVKFASGAMLHIPFEVVAAPAMPATGDNNLPLAALTGLLVLAVTGAFMLRRKVNG